MPGFGPRFDRPLAAVLALSLVASPFAIILHFGASSHHVCDEHLAVEHGPASHDAPRDPDDRGPGAPHDDRGHDACTFASLAPAAERAQDPAPLRVARLESTEAAPVHPPAPSPAEPLYRLAPKTSPPRF